MRTLLLIASCLGFFACKLENRPVRPKTTLRVQTPPPVGKADEKSKEDAKTEDKAPLPKKNPELAVRDVFPSDHPATQRIQYWSDMIDSFLRTNYPAAMENVPKPQVIVVKDDTVNAYVPIQGLCTDYTIATDSGKAGKEFAEFDRAEGTFGSSSDPCVEADSHLAEDMEGLIRWHFSVLKGCKVSFKDRKVNLSKECNYPYEEEKKLVVASVPNIFVFHSGHILIPSEEDAIATIAHELGHYYKAHALQDTKQDYNFLYRLGQHNPEGKPVRDPALDPVKIRLDEAIEKANLSLDFLFSVPEQRYDARVVLLTWSLVTNATVNAEDLKACQTFKTAVAEIQEAAKSFPYKGEGENVPKDDYFAAEAAFEPCANQILMESEENSAEIKTKGLPYISSATLSEFLSNIGTSFPTFYAALGKQLGEAEFSDMGEFARRLQSMFSAIKSDDYADIFAQNIGYYTMEQEADDLASEWLYNIGFDPRLELEGELNLLDWQETQGPPTGLSAKECRALYKNNWRDAKGVLVPFLQLADYSDDHHTQCFRVFNGSREIEAHKYKYDPAKQPKKPEPSWEQIRTAVKDWIKAQG